MNENDNQYNIYSIYIYIYIHTINKYTDKRQRHCFHCHQNRQKETRLPMDDGVALD